MVHSVHMATEFVTYITKKQLQKYMWLAGRVVRDIKRVAELMDLNQSVYGLRGS